MNDVSQRKLLHALTADQENTLKKQGASNSLIQSLRKSDLVVLKEEAAAFEAAREEKAGQSRRARNKRWGYGAKRARVRRRARPPDQSQPMGRTDYELAFYAYRCAGEDVVEPALIDTSAPGAPCIGPSLENQKTKCSAASDAPLIAAAVHAVRQ